MTAGFAEWLLVYNDYYPVATFVIPTPTPRILLIIREIKRLCMQVGGGASCLPY